ncbi:GNAT family N-acetyltransferase [Alterisphingorhabdus coralli]|uniref:N-acetyltransferase n=1 Tax=Alterisphingorhabdus coralli TaxID=3071408 RepID=A0AA97F817_9SPHN|nr:N-acetyltransferase [Parasphingorhabdus sp. SCSIO 66989]WOE76044.1 N-acetyltransferase [Parasphingorhabdus sp. SCSIO 66989]
MSMATALDLNLRAEEPEDQAAIHDLTKRAFAPMPYADGDEQDLVDALRAAGALAISLVAESEGRVVGHVAFSPAVAADGASGWYALGPVSVEPEVQKTGIGSALINSGLDMLRHRNAAGCVLVGNPDYYHRFGFRPAPQCCPGGEPAEYYQLLPMGQPRPDGIIGFHPLFHAAQS